MFKRQIYSTGHILGKITPKTRDLSHKRKLPQWVREKLPQQWFRKETQGKRETTWNGIRGDAKCHLGQNPRCSPGRTSSYSHKMEPLPNSSSRASEGGGYRAAFPHPHTSCLSPVNPLSITPPPYTQLSRSPSLLLLSPSTFPSLQASSKMERKTIPKLHTFTRNPCPCSQPFFLLWVPYTESFRFVFTFV